MTATLTLNPYNYGRVDAEIEKINERPYIVEFYTSNSTSYSWYRVWSNGWVEQGGQLGRSSTTITFLIAFADTYYVPIISGHTGSATYASCSSTSTTYMTVYKSSTVSFAWYAAGRMAS